MRAPKGSNRIDGAYQILPERESGTGARITSHEDDRAPCGRFYRQGLCPKRVQLWLASPSLSTCDALVGIPWHRTLERLDCLPPAKMCKAQIRTLQNQANAPLPVRTLVQLRNTVRGGRRTGREHQNRQAQFSGDFFLAVPLRSIFARCCWYWDLPQPPESGTAESNSASRALAPYSMPLFPLLRVGASSQCSSTSHQLCDGHRFLLAHTKDRPATAHADG